MSFGYDYLGRRTAKEVDTGWNGTTYTSTTSWQRYLYDGWNCIAVGDVDVASNGITITKHYFWGLDLSGSIDGAGGVGGLLMVQGSGNTYLPAYDAMGNLAALMTESATTLNSVSYAAGDVVAAYEYDAFGQTLRASEAYAADNPFRFSTKYTDDETSLVYYGHRYYNPSLGRFQNRDPIEEQGGLNLYSFCSNNAINLWDLLGNLTWGAEMQAYYASLSPEERARQSALWDTFSQNDYIDALYAEAQAHHGYDLVDTVEFGEIPLDYVMPFALRTGLRTGDINDNINNWLDSWNAGGMPSAGSSSSDSGADTGRGDTSGHDSSGTTAGGSTLGDTLRHIPLVGGVLGGVGDIASGIVGAAAGVVTMGHSGTFGSGLHNVAYGLGGIAMGTLDLAGKAWTIPNTTIGLVAGLVGLPFGAKIGVGNNAIQFTNYPWGDSQGGALTLGNVQLFHNGPLVQGPSGSGDRYNLAVDSSGRRIQVNTGRHEEAHTYQYQLLGPFFLPTYFIRGGIPTGPTDVNPLENAADDYAEGIGGWWP